jgi:hypothetical protein
MTSRLKLLVLGSSIVLSILMFLSYSPPANAYPIVNGCFIGNECIGFQGVHYSCAIGSNESYDYGCVCGWDPLTYTYFGNIAQCQNNE